MTCGSREELTDDGEVSESFTPPRQHHERILLAQIVQPPSRVVVVGRHIRHRIDDVQRAESRRHVTRDEVDRGDINELAEEHAQVREWHRRAQHVQETGGAIHRVDQIERDFDGRVRGDEPTPGVVGDLLPTVLDAVHVDDESLEGRRSRARRESIEELLRDVIVVNAEDTQARHPVQVRDGHLYESVRVGVLLDGRHVKRLEHRTMVLCQEGQEDWGMVAQLLQAADGQVLQTTGVLDDRLQRVGEPSSSQHTQHQMP